MPDHLFQNPSEPFVIPALSDGGMDDNEAFIQRNLCRYLGALSRVFSVLDANFIDLAVVALGPDVGRIIRQLTENIGIDTSPSWSPDGTRFAFVSDRAGSPQIYVKDTGSGSVRRLTFQGRYNTQPSWSPKGDQIAYSSFAGSEINIQVIDTQGRSPIQLTRGARQNEAPSWSPDGSMIVFSSNREGAFRIYVMTAYGTDQRRLLTLPGEQTNPKWSPRITNN